MTPLLAIFDLDGTLAEHSHRNHLAPQGDERLDPRAWDAFNLACADDAPITHTLAIMKALHTVGHKVIIMTSRNEVAYPLTRHWLAAHGGSFAELFMRGRDDDAEPVTLKARFAQELMLTQHNTLCAFDDDPAIVEMWRGLGIHCLQVGDAIEERPLYRVRR